MVNPALHGAAMTGPKKSAKDKYTATSVLQGKSTTTDKRVVEAKKREDDRRVEASKQKEKMPVSDGASSVASAKQTQLKEQQASEMMRAMEERKREIAERQKIEKPGGWKNVVDVMKIALNPFSKDRIETNTGSEAADAVIGAVANNPYSAAGIVTGAAGLIRGATAGIAAVTSKTAVQQAGKIGTKGLIIESGKGVASTMATNTATKKVTASFLTKAVGAVKDPAFVVGALMATIGSYPFAGFIKEEALQTVGFGVGVAMQNGDIEGAEEAIRLQEDILDPGTWDEIKSKIPFVNVVSSLDDFYSAARLKLDIDKKVISDLKIKSENGETDAEMYARIANERAMLKEQERISDAEYYKGIEERKAAAKAKSRAEDKAYYAGLSADAAAKKKKERAEDEAYWAKILNNRPADEASKARLDDDYWNEYYKTLAKVKANSAPSNLKFGLL